MQLNAFQITPIRARPNYSVILKKGDGVSRMTLETNEQILHQMNINLELLEVSDGRLTQTLSVTSTIKTSCIKTVLDNKIQKNTTLSKMF